MPEPLEKFLAVQHAYAPNLTPDAKALAFISDQSGSPQLWRVQVPVRQGQPLWPDRLSFSADRVLGVWVSPNPERPRLIYAHDQNGTEKAQLTQLYLDDLTETSLTEGFEDAMHSFQSWHPSGKTFLFAANRRHPGHFDLYRQRLDGEGELIFQSDEAGYLEGARYASDTSRIAFTRVAGTFTHTLFELEPSTGTVHTLNLSPDPTRYQVIRYLPNGHDLLLITDANSNFLYLARFSRTDRSLTPLAAPEADVECAALAPNGQTVAYSVNEAGTAGLYLLDLDTQQSRAVPTGSGELRVPAVMDGALSFSADSKYLAFSCASATRTNDCYLYSLEGNLTPPTSLTRSAHGGLDPERFATPELIRYPSFDGLEIPAWLQKPGNGQAPYPVVVMVHGGPASQSRPQLNPLTQYLLQQGYAVMLPNVRGSSGYGKRYTQLDEIGKRPDAVADLAHAAHWLRAHADFDQDRLAVYGRSYGGFMVLAVLTEYPGLFSVGIDIVGIGNFVTFLENTSDYRRAHREAEYGSLARDRELLERISPMNQLENLNVPLLVSHGANDPRVPLSEAEHLVAALEQRGVACEKIILEDEGHGITKLNNQLRVYRAAVSFLNKHLQNH